MKGHITSVELHLRTTSHSNYENDAVTLYIVDNCHHEYIKKLIVEYILLNVVLFKSQPELDVIKSCLSNLIKTRLKFNIYLSTANNADTSH